MTGQALLTQPYTLTVGSDVGQWVADRACQGRYRADNSVAIGLLRGERLIAGAIFNQWNHRSVHLHMAIERTTRMFLGALAVYAFGQLGVRKVIAPVDPTNQRSIRALEHAGFVLEARLAEAHPHGDLLLYTMTAEQCPFLDDPYLLPLESYYGR